MAIKTTKITLDYATADERYHALQCCEWLRDTYGSPGMSTDRQWFARIRRPSYRKHKQDEVIEFDAEKTLHLFHELMAQVEAHMENNKYKLMIYFRNPQHATHFALTML